MAISGIIYGTAKKDGSATSNYTFWLEWERNSYSIANNTSNITVSLKVKCTAFASGAYNLDTKPSVSLSVNGEAKTPTVSCIDTRNYVECTFATWTGNVTHNDDGSLSCPITVSFTHYGSTSLSAGSASGDAILDTIPRASKPTVSASTVQMGTSVNIYTNRKSEGFTHTLTYSFGGVTGTIATNVGESYEWTVPDLVSKIPGKTSGACTITCKTYSGSTLVGSDTVTLTLTVPAKSTPTVSASTVRMGTSVNIYTNRKSEGFTHTLKYSIGDASGTIGTGVAAGKTWTPPKSLAASTGAKTSAACTITCETYNGSLLVGTSTLQITLTVPDATVPTLSVSSIELGKPITIYTPREVDCYEHDISYTLKADGSSTVAFSEAFAAPIQESYAWTPSLALLAPKIPSATKGTITITCTTRFKGSTAVVGSVPVPFAITIPDNSTTKPKVTPSVTAVETPYEGVYVQGKSKVKVAYTASSAYSTIKSYETEMVNAKGSTNPYTSPVLANTGTVSVTCKVTDARGYATVKTVDIEVIPYSRPRIIPDEDNTKIVCTRCNSNGTPDPGGVYLLIQAGRMYSHVVTDGVQRNYCKLSYQWKTDAQDDDAYSDPVELLATTAVADYVDVILPGIVSSNTTAYNIRLIAEDDIGETDVVTVTVPTAFVIWHSPVGGHGFTLGGYHDPNKVDVFDCRFDAEFQGNVTGKVLGLGALPEIPEGADFNEYKDFGVYSVAQNTTATTLRNCPSDVAGTLRVWSANGRGVTTGNYVYIMQEYICYDNSATYRRNIQLAGEDSSWEYGVWKACRWQ